MDASNLRTAASRTPEEQAPSYGCALASFNARAPASVNRTWGVLMNGRSSHSAPPSRGGRPALWPVLPRSLPARGHLSRRLRDTRAAPCNSKRRALLHGEARAVWPNPLLCREQHRFESFLDTQEEFTTYLVRVVRRAAQSVSTEDSGNYQAVQP